MISPLCSTHPRWTEVTSNSIVRHPYLWRSLIGRVKCPKANKQFLSVQYTIGQYTFSRVGGWHKSHKTLKAIQPSCSHPVDVIFLKNNFGWLGYRFAKISSSHTFSMYFITLRLPVVYSLRLESDPLSYLTKAERLDQTHPIITTPESDIFG